MARGKKKIAVLSPEDKLQQALVPVEEQPYMVPENWCWVKWGNIGDFIAGNGFKKEYQGFTEYEIPFYKVGSLKYSDANGVLYDGENTINEEMRIQLKATLIPPKAILFAKIGEAIRINRRGINETACCIDNNMMAFVPKCLMRYAFHWSCGIDLYKFTNATTVPAIRKSDLESVPFPLPPLPEQQRIVDRIESLFAKLDEAKEKAQAVVDGAKKRKTSLLFQAFTGKLTEQWRAQNEGKYSIDDWLEYEDDVVAQSECPTDLPASWKWIRMGAVGYTNIGLTYSPSDKSDDGIIVLRSSNIQNGKMDYEDIVRVNMSIPDNKMCRKGDLLICARNGSKALVGKTAVVDADGMSYGAFMAIFRSVYNPYIYYFLSSPFFRDLIDKDVGTTTINQVTQAIIKNLPLPFAPKEEQNEVVRILSGLLDKEDTIIETATRAIDQIEGIKKSILARAFRGELGTNDPNDESAVELLKSVL